MPLYDGPTRKRRPNESLRMVIKAVREGPVYPKDLQKQLEMSDRVVDACLKRGAQLGIFRQLRDKRYAWVDYVEIVDVLRQEMVKFELLYCRAPTLEELSISTGTPPDSLLEHLGKVAWKAPTDEDKANSPSKARLRLELAAWVKKLGSSEIRQDWPKIELQKAKEAVEKYPEYIPDIVLHEGRDGPFYTLTWPSSVDSNISEIILPFEDRAVIKRYLERTTRM